MQGPYCPKPKTFSPDEHGLAQRGAKNEKTTAFYYSLRKYYERDSAYLGLIAGFIQDGPQLILQLYILAIRQQDADKRATNVTYVGE